MRTDVAKTVSAGSRALDTLVHAAADAESAALAGRVGVNRFANGPMLSRLRAPSVGVNFFEGPRPGHAPAISGNQVVQGDDAAVVDAVASAVDEARTVFRAVHEEARPQIRPDMWTDDSITLSPAARESLLGVSESLYGAASQMDAWLGSKGAHLDLADMVKAYRRHFEKFTARLSAPDLAVRQAADRDEVIARYRAFDAIDPDGWVAGRPAILDG